ncbi:MAG: PilC/PilY family type IV pilus protein [Acidobacteriota bacterium]
MRNGMKILCVTGLALLLGLGVVNADDRDLLRSITAPPNVLLVLDSGSLMTFNGQTNNLNFLTGGDDGGGFTDYMEHVYSTDAEQDAGLPSAYLEGNLLTSYPDYLVELNRGSKLVQAKSALRTFFNTGFEFNFGFSYYNKKGIQSHYHNYIYRVTTVDQFDTDGDGFIDAAMLDGTPSGTPLRFGSREDYKNLNSWADPAYPIRFGIDGTDDYILWEGSTPVIPDLENRVLNVFYNNWSEQEPDSFVTGDRRIVSYIVTDATGTKPWSEIPPADPQRINGKYFYYPAYDWSEVPNDVQQAMTGGPGTWTDIADDIAIALGLTFDTTDPRGDWKWHVRDYAVEAIEFKADGTSNQVGSQTLYIKEELQVYNAALPIDDQWVTVNSSVTEVEYVKHFALYDHDPAVDGDGVTTLSSFEMQGDTACTGFMEQDPSTGKTPVIGIDEPAPAPVLPGDPPQGSTRDQREMIKTMLEPQTNPVYYFPTHTDIYLPQDRLDYIPLTETVFAFGRRPIKDTISMAGQYFGQTVSTWDDHLAACRQNFVILITDGQETCSSDAATCSLAATLGNAGLSIYVIYIGSEDEDAQLPDLSSVQCIADNSGGDWFTASSEEDLVNALLSIGRSIEEKTRGFSSPMVPSVEASTKQTAYLSTFTPFQERSMWRGHLRAYPINPVTGVVANLDEDTGIPSVSDALWDAGDILAERDFASPDPRMMYYGRMVETPADSGIYVPARRPFAYPGFDSGTFELRKELYDLIWPDVPDPVDYDAEDEFIDRVPLRNTIDFIRGERFGTDADEGGNDVPLRDSEWDTEVDPPVRIWSSSYLWCGATGDVDGDAGNLCAEGSEIKGIEKLGDIFHSVPQRMSAPACFACYLSDYQDYRSFLTNHRQRRTVMFAGSNGGTMHAFDAGLFDAGYAEPQTDAGTGRELFAWVPSSVMDEFPDLRSGVDHRYTVDGTGTVADVFIDPVNDSTPVEADREWRTLLMWGQRRGGRSYVALDITQPDTYTLSDGHYNTDLGGSVAFVTETVTDVDGNVLYEWESLDSSGLTPDSGRDPMCADGTDGGCSGAWPAFRWEFTDTSDEEADIGFGIGNGEADLGYTWSRPLVAFVHVDDGGEEDRMVAFFGGGFSAFGVLSEADKVTGNWIYGLDVETGEILLKLQVEGMVPGGVQGLDIDLDGFLEKLYFATTAGNIYRIDFSDVGAVDSGTGRVTNWEVEKIFDADGYQPFFMRPALVPITFNADGTANVAIAIGSGDRDGIFETNASPHRFYVFNEPTGDPVVAVTDSDLQGLNLDSGDQTENFLASDTVDGWYLELYDSAVTDNWEKVNTNALVLLEYVIFSTFNPVEGITVVDGDTPDEPQTCERGGSARTYVVGLASANPRPGKERYEDLGEDTAMVSDPVVYLGADGKIHVIQATDNLELEEPIASFDAPVRMVNWREE